MLELAIATYFGMGALVAALSAWARVAHMSPLDFGVTVVFWPFALWEWAHVLGARRRAMNDFWETESQLSDVERGNLDLTKLTEKKTS